MAGDTFQEMDNAANEAEKDLENIPNETLVVTARWSRNGTAKPVTNDWGRYW